MPLFTANVIKIQYNGIGLPTINTRMVKQVVVNSHALSLTIPPLTFCS